MITGSTYRSSTQVAGTAYDVVVRLVTDDARGTFDQMFRATGTTQLELRDDVSRQIAQLNVEFGIKNVLAGLAVGTVIPVTYTPPAATAFQTWQKKAQQLVRIKQAQDAGVVFIAQEITDLKAAVNTGVQAGYGAQF